MDRLTTGSILEGRYRIRGLLGQGGMSRVYLADALHLRMLVAIKENLQTSADARAQFEREAQMLARLSHPNIPRVIERFTSATTGRQYLVMEYIAGEGLDTMIKRVGPVPEATALNWIRQVVSALRYLHAQNPPVIHRDIKPANIKITPHGKAVLVDFGISKLYDPRGATMTGARAVTPGYAAPEQYGLRTDERSDVYSLGATLYTMLTGRVPPEAPLRISEADTLIPPHRIVPGISPTVESTVLRALEVSTSRRWRNVRQLSDALEGGVPVQAPTRHAATVFAPPRGTAVSGGQSIAVWLVPLSVLVLVLVVALALAVSNPFRPTPVPVPSSRTVAAGSSATQPLIPIPVPPTSVTLPAVPVPARGILRIPGNDPSTLDPALAGDANSGVYIVEIFSGLAMLDQDLRVQPDLAYKWDVSADRTVYTFYLRRDARFHDGRPVTAQDFKYSIERAANPATASSTADTYLGDIVGVKDRLNSRASSISGVRILDDYTLQIKIDAPKAYFLAKLSYPTAYVVDKNNVEAGGRAWTDKPNGTGPYKLKEYVRGQRLVLSRNENYYLDPKPQVDQVHFILGGGSLITMYENGDLDSVRVSSGNIERVTDSTSPLNKELFVGPELQTQFIVFNIRKPPFDDPKVRQAFALAIDRRKVATDVYRKMNVVAKSILPPGTPGYNDALPEIEYNVSQARQLLLASRYAGRLPKITWYFSGEGTAVQAMTQMLTQTFAIDIATQQKDWATFIGQVHDPSNPYEIFNIGWIADYPDPQNYLDILFRSNSAGNWSGYSNPEVDRLLDQAAVEKDVRLRFQLYQQAEQKILRDYPVIPFTHSRQYWLTKPYVRGMIYPSIIIPRLRYVSVNK